MPLILQREVASSQPIAAAQNNVNLGLLEAALNGLKEPAVQAMTAAGTIDKTVPVTTLVGPATGTYAAVLNAPVAGDVQMKLIRMLSTTGANIVTIALPNAYGGTNVNTASFDAANESLLLMNAGTKWMVAKEFGVTLS